MHVAMYHLMIYLHVCIGQCDTVQCPHVECGVICELKHYLVTNKTVMVEGGS